jgi:RimJ/RimL family protein N-acetyltransferase
VTFPLAVQASATAPGLLLRLWTDQDIPAMLEAYRDPLMRRWLLHPVTTEEEARRAVADHRANAEAGKAFRFAIVETAGSSEDGEAASEGHLVGGVSLRRRNDGASGAWTATAEVGYWVAAPARGHGVAPRALEAVCEWGFSTVRNPSLERLELIHGVGNHASCRVAEKTGFPLSVMLPPLLPDFPNEGHLHVRMAPPRPDTPPGT